MPLPQLSSLDDWKRFAARREKERRSQKRLTSREQMIQRENERRMMQLSERRRRDHEAQLAKERKERYATGVEWLADKAKGKPLAERHGPDAYLRHAFQEDH